MLIDHNFTMCQRMSTSIGAQGTVKQAMPVSSTRYLCLSSLTELVSMVSYGFDPRRAGCAGRRGQSFIRE